MSRIHEALNQAGVRTRTIDEAPEAPSTALKDFPAGTETESEIVSDRPAAEGRKPAKVKPNAIERLVVHADVQPLAVEQYRRVAAVLHQAQVERGIRVVMVASAQAGEGKTLTTANVGLTLSESHKRSVLLIDADLRRPSLSTLFHLPNAAGLSESLKAPRDRPLQLTKISDSLSLLPGGRPDSDPMAGLTSGRMQQIIDQAAESFEWVLVDTPPIALLADTRLLADMVDAAILVIDAGTTQHAIVQRAIESIGRDKLVGVVLNRVDQDTVKETSYYKYYRSAVDKSSWTAADASGVTR
jgi:protein-tyrosine kinase